MRKLKLAMFRIWNRVDDVKEWKDNQRGAILQTVLYIAAIALPIAILLLVWGKEVEEWLREQWDKIRE